MILSMSIYETLSGGKGFVVDFFCRVLFFLCYFFFSMYLSFGDYFFCLCLMYCSCYYCPCIPGHSFRRPKKSDVFGKKHENRWKRKPPSRKKDRMEKKSFSLWYKLSKVLNDICL